jgi:hypothetical protein
MFKHLIMNIIRPTCCVKGFMDCIFEFFEGETGIVVFRVIRGATGFPSFAFGFVYSICF